MTVATGTSPLERLGHHIDGLAALVRDLDPDLMSVGEAGALVRGFSRAEKLGASGRTLVARVVNDATALAATAGITRSDAAHSLAASHTAAEQPELGEALRHGSLSGAQVNAVAKGAKANPQKLRRLVHVARTRSVEELRDEARKVALDAKDPNDRHRQQRAARCLRTWVDDLGMLAGSFRLPPEQGAAFKSVLEREGQRRYRAAKRTGTPEHYPAYLADALAELVTKGRTPAAGSPKAEVVIDVSYAALLRGMALEGESCDVRGLGPIPVWRAKEIMEDAFLKALLTHGDDVRLVHHVGRRPSAAVKTALQWRYRGCVDCGSSFHLEDDHVDPWTNDGPTSYENLRPRCWPCHRIKTEADRRSGLLGRDPPRRRE